MTRSASLKSFLATARAALAAPAAKRPRPLTFVVGNESADLDSLCSALVLAYIRSGPSSGQLHIPLSNLPREDLKLRTEMSPVLHHAGLEFSDLLTLSELPDLPAKDTQWLLVDHNVLTGQLTKYQSRVIGCIDHHVDEGVIPQDVNPRVIEHCGSCMSLVVEQCRADWKAMSSVDNTSSTTTDQSFTAPTVEDAQVAKLGLAAILIDTINLTAKEKMTEKDPQAADFLVNMTGDTQFDRTQYFDEISAVKEDLSGLSFRDIFRKDYKEWEESGIRLGVSCVVQDFDYLLDKAGDQDTLTTELHNWASERQLDVAAVMTTSHPDGEFHRHLLVWAISQDKGTRALREFVRLAKKPLGLVQWKNGQLDMESERLAWTQENLAASRKQVAPLLRDALKAIQDSQRKL